MCGTELRHSDPASVDESQMLIQPQPRWIILHMRPRGVFAFRSGINSLPHPLPPQKSLRWPSKVQFGITLSTTPPCIQIALRKYWVYILIILLRFIGFDYFKFISLTPQLSHLAVKAFLPLKTWLVNGAWQEVRSLVPCWPRHLLLSRPAVRSDSIIRGKGWKLVLTPWATQLSHSPHAAVVLVNQLTRPTGLRIYSCFWSRHKRLASQKLNRSGKFSRNSIEITFNKRISFAATVIQGGCLMDSALHRWSAETKAAVSIELLLCHLDDITLWKSRIF